LHRAGAHICPSKGIRHFHNASHRPFPAAGASGNIYAGKLKHQLTGIFLCTFRNWTVIAYQLSAKLHLLFFMLVGEEAEMPYLCYEFTYVVKAVNSSNL
jgi:hypothetical protein